MKRSQLVFLHQSKGLSVFVWPMVSPETLIPSLKHSNWSCFEGITALALSSTSQAPKSPHRRGVARQNGTSGHCNAVQRPPWIR